MQVRELDFHRSALAFIRVVEGAAVRLEELSQSKTASDVIEVSEHDLSLTLRR